MKKQRINQTHRDIVYRYYTYLKKNHLGAENGIPRAKLCEKFNINLETQKGILREINESEDFDKIISTSKSIYMCKRKQECIQAIHNEIQSGLARLNKGKTMARKVDKNNQYKLKLGDYFKDTISVYED